MCVEYTITGIPSSTRSQLETHVSVTSTCLLTTSLNSAHSLTLNDVNFCFLHRKIVILEVIFGSDLWEILDFSWLTWQVKQMAARVKFVLKGYWLNSMKGVQ